MFETKILMAIIFFLALAGFFSTLAPPEYQIMNPIDFAILGGGLIGVAGSCAVITGIPCAIALVAFGFLNLLALFITGITWVKTIVIIPLTIVVIYLASRLARGGG